MPRTIAASQQIADRSRALRDAAFACPRIGDPAMPRAGCFWGQLGTATLNSANQWTYAVTEVHEKYGSGGYGGIVPGGRVVSAVNRAEAPNAATGVQGSGDNLADFVGGSVLRPLGPGSQWPIYSGHDCAGTLVYWFAAPNNVGGTC